MEFLDWVWVVAAVLMGGATGSFLNVVIYRLPRGLSVSEPKRSFCPLCGTSIAMYDNIPVLSFLLLGGKCRKCRAPISVRYPVVEMLTVLLFLLVADTFLVPPPARNGIGDLATDWPIIVAHLFLAASLLAISGIDIEEYIVDVRITWLVIGVGCVAHAVWASGEGDGWWWPGSGMAGVTAGAAVGLVIARLLWPPPPEPEEEASAAAGPVLREPQGGRKDARPTSGRFLLVWLLLAALVAALGMIVIDASAPAGGSSFALRAALILLCCFGGIVGASAVQRESDQEIVDAIEEERPFARRAALGELLYLSPAIVLGLGALLLLRIPDVWQGWYDVLTWSPIAGHQPVVGLATAVSGMIIGGAIGWGVRIVFTLILGKEAFGLGDVHIMAAAGAVAGWFVVLVGFFVGAVFALAGVVCLLTVKRSRAIPYGPWLSIGVMLGVVAYEPVLKWLWPGVQGLMMMLSGDLIAEGIE